MIFSRLIIQNNLYLIVVVSTIVISQGETGLILNQMDDGIKYVNRQILENETINDCIVLLFLVWTAGNCLLY